jgi:hypothetical protein
LGADVLRTFGAGSDYTFGSAAVGLVHTHSQYLGTTSFSRSNGNISGTMRFDNFELNGKYAPRPAPGLGIAYT